MLQCAAFKWPGSQGELSWPDDAATTTGSIAACAGVA
jgi:hypothetical protein